MGQGRTLERVKDNRRLSSSARTTRKHSSSDRALREASDRGTKPIQKEKGRSTTDNRRTCISGNRPTPDPYGDYIPKGSDNTKKQPKRERENTLNLRSDRGHTSFDPAGVTPSRRLRTIWEKRTHSNLQNQSKLESEGQARRPRNPWANKLWAHNHRYSKAAYLTHS